MVTPMFPTPTMVIIFFFYGLSFFVLGFVGFILVKKEIQFSIEKYIWLLAAFGILHGINEWIDMSLMLGQNQWNVSTIEIIKYIQSLILTCSFLFLFSFGFNSVFLNKQKLIRLMNKILISIFIIFTALLLINIFFTNSFVPLKAIDVLSRYFLGFTGSILTAVAFIKFYYNCEEKKHHNIINTSSIFMALFFIFYGIASGLIVPKIGFWPASVFNYENFILLTGIPIQIFRTAFAFGIAICIFGILKISYSSFIEDIKKEAEIDALTKLKNRRSFTTDIASLYNYAKRYHRPLSIMFFDIDDFKDYNDTYGHQAGDELLKLLGKTAIKTLREHDLIFRYGGEEFIVLLPETDIAMTKKVAIRFKRAIKKLSLKPNNKKVHKTISIGIVQLKSNYTIKEFVELADQAMYKAKKLGKNRVCIHGKKSCVQ